MPQSTKQVLKEYIESKGRVAYKLQQLTKLFRYYKNGVHCISKLLKGTQNPIKIFKILILLHHCYVEGVLELAGVLELFGLMKHVPKKCFQQQLQIKLCQEVIPQYKLYLQKCFSLQQQKRLQRQGIKPEQSANSQKCIQKRSFFSNSQRTIKVNPSKDSHSQTPQILAAQVQIFNSKEEELYAKLNLLKSCLSFIDILFTFGRYFQKNHQYIVDFNIIVAKDVKTAYDQVRVLLQSKVQLFDSSAKAVLESVHQKMYIVYYNCYFFKYSKKYEPIWIDLPYSKLQQIEESSPLSLEQTLQSYKKIVLTQNKHKSPMLKPSSLQYERTGKGLFSKSRSKQENYSSSNKNELNTRDKKSLHLDSTYEKDDRSERVNSEKMEYIHEDISQFVVRDFDHEEQSVRKDEDGYEDEDEDEGDNEDRDQNEDGICYEGMSEQCIDDNYALFKDLRRVVQVIDQHQRTSSKLINTQL